MDSSTSAPAGENDGTAVTMDFDYFYRATWPRLFDTARRLAGRDEDMAQEATQQAFVEMLRRWPQRRHLTIETNRRYTAGIVWNKIMDQFRQRRRLAELDEIRDSSSVPLQVSEPEPEYRALLRRLDEQPPRQRSVAIMYFLEDMSCDEIAKAMGTAPSTVRSQLQRARADLMPYAEKLRDALKDGGQ